VLFFLYAYRSLRSRIRANLISLLVLSLFVAGATLGLSYYLMLKSSLVSVPAENLIVLAKGAATEWESRLAKESVNKIPLLPGIKKDGETPLVASEMASFIFSIQEPDPKKFNEPPAIRGIDALSPRIHQAKLEIGALPAPGTLEVAVGKRLAARFPFIKIGYVFDLPGGPSKVTGIFSANGGPFEDELWTPRPALELHTKLRFTNSLTIVAESAARAEQMVKEINDSKELEAQASTVAAFRADGAGLASIAQTVFVLLILMSLIATFAITTTMNAAVALRIPELAALAAIGIRRSSLARLMLVESALLGVVGAVVGVLVAVGVAALVDTVPLGRVPIAVEVSTAALVTCLLLGVAAGIVGGVAPAVQVRRLNILTALR